MSFFGCWYPSQIGWLCLFVSLFVRLCGCIRVFVRISVIVYVCVCLFICSFVCSLKSHACMIVSVSARACVRYMDLRLCVYLYLVLYFPSNYFPLVYSSRFGGEDKFEVMSSYLINFISIKRQPGQKCR